MTEAPTGRLTVDALRTAVADGAIDTVIAAMVDMQGRLVGKRVTGRFFVDEVAQDGVHACSYLLACDVEMEPLPGYQLTSWATGYHDVWLRPDLGTLRRLPWLEATALVLCDVNWHDGTPVEPSPRQVLKAQMERVAALGFTPMAGSELEFYLLRETYEEAWARRSEDLTPVHKLRQKRRVADLSGVGWPISNCDRNLIYIAVHQPVEALHREIGRNKFDAKR